MVVQLVVLLLLWTVLQLLYLPNGILFHVLLLNIGHCFPLAYDVEKANVPCCT